MLIIRYTSNMHASKHKCFSDIYKAAHNPVQSFRHNVICTWEDVVVVDNVRKRWWYVALECFSITKKYIILELIKHFLSLLAALCAFVESVYKCVPSLIVCLANFKCTLSWKLTRIKLKLLLKEDLLIATTTYWMNFCLH